MNPRPISSRFSLAHDLASTLRVSATGEAVVYTDPTSAYAYALHSGEWTVSNNGQEVASGPVGFTIAAVMRDKPRGARSRLVAAASILAHRALP